MLSPEPAWTRNAPRSLFSFSVELESNSDEYSHFHFPAGARHFFGKSCCFASGSLARSAPPIDHQPRGRKSGGPAARKRTAGLRSWIGGAVESIHGCEFMVMTFKQSPEQAAQLSQLLMRSTKSSSANYHKWLTPEQFGDRFGLSSGDLSKVNACLFRRALRWNAGPAPQLDRFQRLSPSGLGCPCTAIHRYDISGKMRFANTAPPSVPEAFSDVISGFRVGRYPGAIASDRFKPAFNSGSSHYLVPEDWSTIYKRRAPFRSGLDGTGSKYRDRRRISAAAERPPCVQNSLQFARKRSYLPPLWWNRPRNQQRSARNQP